MVLGFVLGFIAAYVSSAAIVVSWSMRTVSTSPNSHAESKTDQILLEDLRCT